MEQEHNIGRRFLEIAARQPSKVLIKLPKSELTYAEVRTLVLAFALRLRDLGVGRSSCLAIDTTYPSVAAAGMLGGALLGARWVQATKAALAEPRLGITHLIHDGTQPYPSQPGVHQIDPTWSTHPALATNGEVIFDGYRDEGDTWVYVQSSGTTGEPKLMPLTYRAQSERARTEVNVTVGGDLVVAMAGGPLTLNGIGTLCGAILRGGTAVVGGDYAFWQSCSVTFVPGTPIQHARRLADASPPLGQKLPLARVGGAKASPELIQRLFQFFDRVAIGYGSTEAGVICSRSITQADEDVDELGPPVGGAEIEIVDANDEPVPRDVEGIVRMRTRGMVSSYVTGGEANRAAFRNGWFYPGDIGRISAAGSLKIAGRTDDQLSIGGVKVGALVVDRALEGIAAVTDGISFLEAGQLGVPSLSVVVSLREGTDGRSAAETIRAHCAKTISRAIVPTNIYVAPMVPRTPNGKANRRAAAQMCAEWMRF